MPNCTAASTQFGAQTLRGTNVTTDLSMQYLSDHLRLADALAGQQLPCLLVLDKAHHTKRALACSRQAQELLRCRSSCSARRRRQRAACAQGGRRT